MAKTLSVLVVDDMEMMRKVTVGQLAAIGLAHADVAVNGAEALRLLQGKSYDLILSDWSMPVMNGLDLLQSVRASARLAHLPFIMITAEAERSRIEEAIASGVNDLLVKPYTANRLAQSIERALARRPARRAPPLSAPPVEAVPPAPDAPRALASVLLVDDTPENLHLLAELFKGSYRLQAAHNGQKALAICCSDSPPDLVLLDVMMPGMDGFEVARRMREHPNAENVPIIFVTALSEDESRLQGLGLGAVDFISKPINPAQLKLRVDNFMRYVELRRRLQADYDNMLEMARLREDVEAITRHDIKGPLAGVIGMVQALLASPSLERRQSEQLRSAEQVLLQVIDMVNLSTELFKIETGRYQLQPAALPIGDLLRRVAQTARAAFADKHLTIAVDADSDVGTDPICAMGDAMLTYSLLHNLVKNACEAAPAHSRVSMTLTAGAPLRILIANQGVIPDAIRGRFFEKFASSGKAGGSGLGTYSARLLARAQLGEVDFVVSDQDHSTTLVVTLPSR